MTERIGLASARAAYTHGGMQHVSDIMALTLRDLQTIDEVYNFSKSKAQNTSLSPQDWFSFYSSVQVDLSRIRAAEQREVYSQNDPSQMQLDFTKKYTKHSPPKAKSKSPKLKPETTPDVEIDYNSRQEQYRVALDTIKPLIDKQYLNAHLVTDLVYQQTKTQISPSISRDVLNELTNKSHGERVRDWATSYAKEGKTLVEIAQLLGNQHIFAAKTLLAKLGLRVPDGFEKIDYTQTLDNMDKLPKDEQEEVKLICAGKSYKEISKIRGYVPARAGQRIDELGLREVWQCARYLTSNKAAVIVTRTE
jgi:hypothetical protein